jgi:glycosyltransferase involved in cell wall biosynthesis
MNTTHSKSIVSFSVIIPLYNKEKSISTTIESVLNQAYDNFELIIVNDGSTDNSLEIARSFNDSRIQIIDKKNGGVSSARNVGIKAARNEYIIPFDADDLWESFCLAEFNYLIQNFPNAEVFCTSYTSLLENKNKSEKRFYVNDYYLASSISLAKWNMPIMVTGCVCIQKKCFEIAGVYNEQFKQGEDYDLWLRLKDRFIIAKSEVVTLIYRLDTENRASFVDWKKEEVFLERDNKNKSYSKKLYEGCLNLVYLYKKNKNSFLKTNFNWFWIIVASLLYTWYRVFYKIIVGSSNKK